MTKNNQKFQKNLNVRIDKLRNQIKTAPDRPLYYEQLGDFLNLRGNKLEAIEAYLTASSLNPSSTWPDKKASKIRRREGFAGRYDRYPDITGKRKAEGGKRLSGVVRTNKSNSPLVSIITVVYDNQESLQRCIDSVKGQSYENIEYILIDGGSPGETINVILANESEIDYYISEPDNGIYSAMNKGIELAHGDYICLLNSDDYYDPMFVESTVKAALESENNDKRKVDIVYTDYFVDETHLVAQDINEGLLFGHLHVCHNTFLASSQAYDMLGPFNEEYRIVSDAIWMRDAFLKGMYFLKLNKPLFTLTLGGMSSGNTEARRNLFIAEAANSYIMNFPALSIDEAKVFTFLGSINTCSQSFVYRKVISRSGKLDIIRICFSCMTG